METVNEVLSDANSKLQKSFDALKAQFAGLRTGKASPAMVDQIKVDYLLRACLIWRMSCCVNIVFHLAKFSCFCGKGRRSG